MAEPTIAITYVELMNAVCHFIGLGTDYTASHITTAQKNHIDTIVKSGYRQFLFPTVDNHVWSFLPASGTLTTTADQGEDDLPDDFAGEVGSIYYDDGDDYPHEILKVSRERIYRLLQEDDETGEPRCYAIQPKADTPTASAGQRWQVLWYPVPDDAYDLNYRYRVNPDGLTADNPYPVGGAQFGEALIASCLSVAEDRIMDRQGQKKAEFIEKMTAAIADDRRASGGKHFGHINPKGPYFRGRYLHHRSGGDFTVTYNGI